MAPDETQKQKRRRARIQATKAMEQEARAGIDSDMTYEDLAGRIDAQRYAPNGTPFTELLCEISRATLKMDRGLLSAVVVRKDRRIPGDGFFELLRGMASAGATSTGSPAEDALASRRPAASSDSRRRGGGERSVPASGGSRAALARIVHQGV